MGKEIKELIDSQKQKVLSDREQARLRLPVFFGSFDSSFHAFIEQLMNARDELFNHNNGGEIHVTLDEDMKTVTVQDNGRGILIHGIDEDTNKPNYELVFETLFSGGNYDNAYSENLIETIGGNGVGNSTTAYTSLYFQATEFKENKAYQITYHDGCNEKEYTEFDSPNLEHGTRITYMLDDNVYTTNVYNPEDMLNQIRRVSGTSNNIKYYFHYNNETVEFLFDCYEDYVDDANISKLTNHIHFPLKNYEIKAKKDGKEFLEKDRIEVIISLSTEPVQETYLNGGYLPEQGTFYKGIVEGIRKYLQKDIKDKKVKLTDNDIIMSFNIYGIMGSNNPVYSNQTKRASSNEAYKKLASQYMMENMEVFKQENPKTYQQIIEHVSKINGLNVKSEDTIKNLKKKLNEKSSGELTKIKNLIECQCKDRTKNILCICEGKSSLSSILSGRTETEAIFPLRGKILNCLKASDDKIFKNDVILGLLEALGADVIIEKGKPKIIFPPEKLRYSKVYIMVDFDFDGIGSILPLVLTVFYKLMPQLIEEGRIYLCETPKYEIVINKTEEELHAFNDEQLVEITKTLNKGSYTIHYIKGLAELSEKSISLCLSGEMGNAKQLLMGDVEKTIEELILWMGEEVEPRKNYIMEHYEEGDVFE